VNGELISKDEVVRGLTRIRELVADWERIRPSLKLLPHSRSTISEIWKQRSLC
jgi:hypothetical protein